MRGEVHEREDLREDFVCVCVCVYEPETANNYLL